MINPSGIHIVLIRFAITRPIRESHTTGKYKESKIKDVSNPFKRLQPVQ